MSIPAETEIFQPGKADILRPLVPPSLAVLRSISWTCLRPAHHRAGIYQRRLLCINTGQVQEDYDNAESTHEGGKSSMVKWYVYGAHRGAERGDLYARSASDSRGATDITHHLCPHPLFRSPGSVRALQPRGSVQHRERPLQVQKHDLNPGSLRREGPSHRNPEPVEGRGNPRLCKRYHCPLSRACTTRTLEKEISPWGGVTGPTRPTCGDVQ